MVSGMTVIVKAGSETAVPPLSATEIPMLAKLPTLVLAGVPLRAPVMVLNVAQEGWFWILKVSVSPSASLAVGVNE